LKKKVKRNRENNLLPLNYTKEKIRLNDLIMNETINGDREKVNMYKQQLKELEEKEKMEETHRRGNTTIKKSNKRNTQEDTDTQKARQQQKPQQTQSKLNTTDPYARISTNAAASWISVKKKTDKTDTVEPTERQGGEIENKTTRNNVLPKQKIRVDIDINLQAKNPDPSKKPLLKPITTSSFIPANDKVKTLSLSDYKNSKVGN